MKFDEFLREHNIPVAPSSHEHHRSGWINFDCPWCSPRWMHYRMGYHTTGRFVNCWACGRHKLYETVMELTGLPYGAVARALREIGGDAPATFAKPERTKLVLPKGLVALPDPQRKYLKKRKFDVDLLIKLWGIQGFRAHPKYPWRIFIPIHLGGRVVSWTTRSILKEGTRYLSASPEEEAIDHKSILYGEDYCRHSVVVVEGPTDVWRIGPGAACTFGTRFSQAHLERIARYPIRAICYDSQPEAQRQASIICDLLETLPGSTYNVVLNAKDPGEAQAQEIQELRDRFLMV